MHRRLRRSARRSPGRRFGTRRRRGRSPRGVAARTSVRSAISVARGRARPKARSTLRRAAGGGRAVVAVVVDDRVAVVPCVASSSFPPQPPRSRAATARTSTRTTIAHTVASIRGPSHDRARRRRSCSAGHQRQRHAPAIDRTSARRQGLDAGRTRGVRRAPHRRGRRDRRTPAGGGGGGSGPRAGAALRDPLALGQDAVGRRAGEEAGRPRRAAGGGARGDRAGGGLRLRRRRSRSPGSSREACGRAGYGRRRAEQKLRARGLPRPEAEAALDEAYGDRDEAELAREALGRPARRRRCGTRVAPLRFSPAAGFSAGAAWEAVRAAGRGPERSPDALGSGRCRACAATPSVTDCSRARIQARGGGHGRWRTTGSRCSSISLTRRIRSTATAISSTGTADRAPDPRHGHADRGPRDADPRRHRRGASPPAARVYVHCWGGVGRTGTVVGCWLVRHEPRQTVIRSRRIAALRAGIAGGATLARDARGRSTLVRGWRRGR